MPTAYRAVFCREIDSPELVDELWRFRKALFIDEYGWALPHANGRERDQFDTADTVHCALTFNGELIGGFRAIRADRPYLGAEVFPHLASTHPFPRQHDRWEISRFGVRSRGSTLRHARTNYAVMFHFAHRVGARGLVAIADLTYERFLGTLGIRTRRFGPPAAIGEDRHGRPLIAVAGEIPMTGQPNGKLQKLLEPLSSVEIVDASQVLGPARISA